MLLRPEDFGWRFGGVLPNGNVLWRAEVKAVNPPLISTFELTASGAPVIFSTNFGSNTMQFAFKKFWTKIDANPRKSGAAPPLHYSNDFYYNTCMDAASLTSYKARFLGNLPQWLMYNYGAISVARVPTTRSRSLLPSSGMTKNMHSLLPASQYMHMYTHYLSLSIHTYV